ncbi:non-canonical purine NTP diphosphatase [Arenibacter sp. GZD96]|uniref:non-canonical purine NTP diphosphatase n=1 Tax=Aurantibrevibacter litoralis TaxID=3106030 RepID=UPI002AFFFC39|nr:non-canonical purine NTP diphosphatase [Arenibacter sp. GZD-96]MEA1786894.1 non-canonical purine NTP diphosphatase [Arenibacter sp. GZD-96]
MKLVFATHNPHKFSEVQLVMPQGIDLLSLDDIGCIEEIPETGKTLEANAQLKADYVSKHFGVPCFADDTGLLIDALQGAPGVYSARYAGPTKNAHLNMAKVLHEMEGKMLRSAHFKTVIALNLDGKSYFFVGEVHGEITTSIEGNGGFGYDPIFRPTGYMQTFAQLTTVQKNTMSHRGQAVRELITFLNTR